MNLKKATEILSTHQKWRRGADIPQTDPKELGEAIDVVLEYLEKEFAKA